MYKLIDSANELDKIIIGDLIPYIKSTTRPIIALDLETYSTDGSLPRPILTKNGVTGHIRTMQLGLDPDNPISLDGKQFIIDVKKIGYEVITKKLKKILENVFLLGHNIKYDYQFLWSLLKIYPKKMIDTMLINQVLYAGDIKRHSLGDLYRQTLDYSWFRNCSGKTFDEYNDFKKQQQVEDWSEELSPESLQYAADDVFYIFFVYQDLKERLDLWEKAHERGFKPRTGIKAVINLEFKLIPVYALMELRGVPFDAYYQKNHLVAILINERDAAEKRCLHLTKTYVEQRRIGNRKSKVFEEMTITEPINLRSPMQLKPVLEGMINKDFNEAGFNSIQLEGTGEEILKRFLNDKRLEKRLSEKTKETLRDVLSFKKASSLLSKFGEKLLDNTTDLGFIHPSWFQIGSADNSVTTGRSSCREPNLQQIVSRGVLFGKYDAGKLFRTAFKAKAGYKLVCADYAQIEARLAALICGDKDLINRFNEDSVDIYGAIAKAMMNLDYEPQKESKNDYERFLRNYIGKTAGLSLLYGTHWKSLSRWMFDKTDGKVVWEDTDAESAYNNFFKNFPKFREATDHFKKRVLYLPKQAGETLFPFTQRKYGELIPYFIAFSGAGLRRPRRFVLKNEYLKMNEFQLSSKGPKPLDEEGNIKGSNPYFERLGSAVREGFNHEIQSTAANILKYAALLINNEFEENGFDWNEGIIALVHDEVLCHVREDRVELTQQIVSRCMKRAGEELATGLVFNVKPGVGDTWAEAK